MDDGVLFFFFSLSFFHSRKLQEEFTGEAFMPLEPQLVSAELGMTPKCVHWVVCMGSPLPVKALQVTLCFS